MVFAYLGAAIVVGGIAWLLGPLMARAFGIFIAGFGLLFTIICGTKNLPTPAAGFFAIFLVGGVIWLAGHWMYAVKHHDWISPFARRLFSQTALRRIDPTRRWGVRVVPPE